MRPATIFRCWTRLQVALIALFLAYLVGTEASSAIILWNVGNLAGALALLVFSERVR